MTGDPERTLSDVIHDREEKKMEKAQEFIEEKLEEIDKIVQEALEQLDGSQQEDLLDSLKDYIEDFD